MQPRKENNDSKKTTAAKPAETAKTQASTKEGGFLSIFFGKADEPNAKPVPKKLDDQKKPQPRMIINLETIHVTPAEIKALLEKALDKEKNAIGTKIKSFIGSKKQSEEDTPLGRFKDFVKDISFEPKNLPLSLKYKWILVQYAMHPEIKPDSEDHKLYQEAIGAKLDIAVKHNNLLTKLRWWNNYYKIPYEEFSSFVHRAMLTTDESEIDEFRKMKLRKKPIIEGIADKANRFAADISGAVDSVFDKGETLSQML